MEEEIRLRLLTSIPESEWDEIRLQLGEISIPQEQAAFGGDPAGFIELQIEDGRDVFLIYIRETLVGVGSLLVGDIASALWPPETRAVQLRGFLIDSALQGKGIGTRAARLTIELAKTVDPQPQHLTLTVNQRNSAARRAYEKAGFATLPDPYTGGPLGPQDIMYVELGS